MTPSKRLDAMAGNSASTFLKVRTASGERTCNYMGDLEVAAKAFCFCEGIFPRATESDRMNPACRKSPPAGCAVIWPAGSEHSNPG